MNRPEYIAAGVNSPRVIVFTWILRSCVRRKRILDRAARAEAAPLLGFYIFLAKLL